MQNKTNRKCITCSVDGAVRIRDLDDENSSIDDKDAEPYLSIGKDVVRMRLEPTEQKTFAAGGKEHLLKLWDIENKKCLFQSKNVSRVYNRSCAAAVVVVVDKDGWLVYFINA